MIHANFDARRFARICDKFMSFLPKISDKIVYFELVGLNLSLDLRFENSRSSDRSKMPENKSKNSKINGHQICKNQTLCEKISVNMSHFLKY